MGPEQEGVKGPVGPEQEGTEGRDQYSQSRRALRKLRGWNMRALKEFTPGEVLA